MQTADPSNLFIFLDIRNSLVCPYYLREFHSSVACWHYNFIIQCHGFKKKEIGSVLMTISDENVTTSLRFLIHFEPLETRIRRSRRLPWISNTKKFSKKYYIIK